MVLLATKFSLVALTVLAGASGISSFGETYLPQVRAAPARPAFIEQLPESALVKAAPAQRPEVRKRASVPKRKKLPKKGIHLASQARNAPASEFPSVETGTDAKLTLTEQDLRFPSVGRGTIGQ